MKCEYCRLEFRKIDLERGICGECEEKGLDQIDSAKDRVDDSKVPL